MSCRIFCTIFNSAVYEGDTSKCLYVWGKKHLEELSSGNQSNAMVMHNKRCHPQAFVLNLRMEGLIEMFQILI